MKINMIRFLLHHGSCLFAITARGQNFLGSQFARKKRLFSIISSASLSETCENFIHFAVHILVALPIIENYNNQVSLVKS